VLQVVRVSVPFYFLIMKTCKECGANLAHNNISGLCKNCNPIRTSSYVKDSRRRRKQLLIEHKGGSCEICGYDKSIRALSFHHKDPTQKDYGLAASGVCHSLERDLAEVEKCILVCANCHCEIHDGLINIPQ